MELSERNLDCGGRFRNRSVAFRMSDAEADRLNQLVAISGLTKQDYITQCLLERKVVVKPSFRIYQKVHREVFKLYDEWSASRASIAPTAGLFPFSQALAYKRRQ
jgi:predicted DNA-binding protein